MFINMHELLSFFRVCRIINGHRKLATVITGHVKLVQAVDWSFIEPLNNAICIRQYTIFRDLRGGQKLPISFESSVETMFTRVRPEPMVGAGHIPPSEVLVLGHAEEVKYM